MASLFLGICPTRVGSVFFSVTKTSEGPDSSLRGGLKQQAAGPGLVGPVSSCRPAVLQTVLLSTTLLLSGICLDTK